MDSSSQFMPNLILNSHTFRAGGAVASTLSFSSREVIFCQTTRGSKSQGYHNSWDSTPGASGPGGRSLQFPPQAFQRFLRTHISKLEKLVNKNHLPESFLNNALKNIFQIPRDQHTDHFQQEPYGTQELPTGKTPQVLKCKNTRTSP